MTTAASFARASWWTTVLAAGLIVLAAVAAYCNSFAGTFVYDDQTSIVENQTIRQLWPVWQVLFPPSRGETVGGRPLLNLSLAINYAEGGLAVWSYHATNLAIHIAAALLLMGILRRTFLTPALRDRFGRAATPLALASALLWTVHPLQTESVTYIIQRAESLAGLFYLLTLYCVIRGASAAGTVPFFAAGKPNLPKGVPGEKGDCPPRPTPWPTRRFLWYAAAVFACLLGMGTKEVMVTAPLVVLLYDRTFLAGSLAAAWRRRWGLYLGLAATWALLVYLVLSTGLITHQPEMGAPNAWGYARTQPGVVLHYLRLSVWPKPLCLDYVCRVASGFWEIFPGVSVLGLLAAITLWGLVKQSAWGFFGAWFFLILAPTSSIFPLAEFAFEHRMYLPLAAVVVLTVAGGYLLWDDLLPRPAKSGVGAAVVRWSAPAAVLAVVLAALGCATFARNSDYQSLVVFWEDTVKKHPDSYFAQCALGNALTNSGRTAEAIEHYHKSLLLKPNYATAYNNLGLTLAGLGRTAEAIDQYQKSLLHKPDYATAHNNLGNALASLGIRAAAIQHYYEAVRLKPDFADAHYNLGRALAAVGRTSEAVEHYIQFLQLVPKSVEVIDDSAWLLAVHEPAEGGDPARAVQLAEHARQLAGEENVPCLDTLAAAYAAAGRYHEAATAAQRAVELAESAGQAAVAKMIRGRLELYRAGRPYREPPHAPEPTGTDGALKN